MATGKSTAGQNAGGAHGENRDMASSADFHRRFARTAFPEKPSGAYLDTASIGLVPTTVRTAVAECYEALGAGVRGMQRTHAAGGRRPPYVSPSPEHHASTRT